MSTSVNSYSCEHVMHFRMGSNKARMKDASDIKMTEEVMSDRCTVLAGRRTLRQSWKVKSLPL